MTNRKISYTHPGDPGSETAVCTNCEEPSSPDNPIVPIKRPGRPTVLSHIHCPSYKDFAKEQQENQDRNGKTWEFAATNKYIAPVVAPPLDGTVEKTHPIIKIPKVRPIQRTEATSQYDDDNTGASNPPSR